MNEMDLPIECQCYVCLSGGIINPVECSQCHQLICTGCRLQMKKNYLDFCPMCKSKPFKPFSGLEHEVKVACVMSTELNVLCKCEAFCETYGDYYNHLNN